MKKNVAYIILFGCILVFIAVADLWKEEKHFSESENRILAQKPTFHIKQFIEGNFREEYEEYVSDQFLYRDTWILLKTYADIAFAKKEINGVYLVSSDTLLEKHDVKMLEEKSEEKLEQLKELSKWCDGKYDLSVILVPTADEVYKDKLPKYAPHFDQENFLNEAEQIVGSTHFINVEEILKERKRAYIYYRTDHHWTTLGAFYAYQVWGEKKGVEPLSLDKFTRETISEDFLGTLQSKVNIPMKPDKMEIFIPKVEQKYSIYYDFTDEVESRLYEKKYFNRKDKYSAFLNGNHAFIEIQTENHNGKNVMVVKDSYANCFIPFLTSHYENIYVVDFRYYRGNLQDLLEEYEVDDILVLYNVVHFIEEFRY